VSGHSSAAGALALVCTALAYVMYFRLIAHVGATRAVTVTFLIPAFALAWGALFLAEPVTGPMLVWGAVILAGTLLATGLWPRQAAAAGAASGR
jgi:drug/metabolite transporter (DMT)-like permease